MVRGGDDRTQGVAWSTEPVARPSENAFVGAVRLPAAIRSPAEDGDDTLEVLVCGSDAARRVGRVLPALDALLAEVPAMTTYALDHAPEVWRAFFVDGAGASERRPLWLMAISFEGDGSMRLYYDYGALGMLVLTQHHDGRRVVAHED